MLRLAAGTAFLFVAAATSGMAEVGADAPLRERVEAFVDEVVRPAQGLDRGAARWNSEVCVGVQNLQNDAAQYLVDRISVMALDLGLETGEPGCAPSVLITFSGDGADSAASMVATAPRTFHTGVGGTDWGSEALAEFQSGDRPVRWWYLSAPFDTRSGLRAIHLPGDPGFGLEAAVTRDIGGGSRLYSNLRDDLINSWVIVDANQLEGITWDKLADYVGMVALAQINPDAETAGYDTILNLPEDVSEAQGLTSWDRAFLEALYKTNPSRLRLQRQEEIAEAMARELRGEE